MPAGANPFLICSPQAEGQLQRLIDTLYNSYSFCLACTETAIIPSSVNLEITVAKAAPLTPKGADQLAINKNIVKYKIGETAATKPSSAEQSGPSL